MGAAWRLGVTADMISCAIQKGDPKYENVDRMGENASLTIRQYLDLGFGTEKQFWIEASTKMLIEDVSNRVVTLDDAAFQLGIAADRVMKKVGKIKSDRQVHDEKVAKLKQES